MNWEAKAVMTAAAVLVVMGVVRWGGRRLGGLAAALPIITAPTLWWLADEAGVDFAVEAAIGSVAACAMLAAFALCYARAARFGGPVYALLSGLAGAGLLVPLSRWASGRLVDALVLACGVCALAWASMPDWPVAGLSPPTRRRAMLLVSAVAAAASVIAAHVGPSIGGFAAGMVSSLPIITAAVTMAEHAGAGHRAAGRFLSGYVAGLFGKAIFGALVAMLAPRLGMPTALLLGCAGATLASALQWRVQPSQASTAPAS